MPGALWSVVRATEQRVASTGSQGLGYALGTLTWALAGGVYVAAKSTTAEMPSWTFTFFRALLAALFLVPFVWRQRREMVAFFKQRPLAAFLVGATGLGMAQGLIFTSLHYTSAINAGIIFTSAPLITLALAAVFLREAFGPWQVIGSIIAFAGIVVITVQGSLATLLGLDLNFGDLLCIIAAVIFAGYTVALKRAGFKLGRLPLLVVLLFCASVATFPFFFYELVTGQHDKLTASGIFGLLYAGALGGSLLYLCYNSSVDLLGAGLAGNLMYLQMAFIAFFSWLILGESLYWYHFLGAGLIVVGVFLVEALKPKAAATPAK